MQVKALTAAHTRLMGYFMKLMIWSEGEKPYSTTKHRIRVVHVIALMHFHFSVSKCSFLDVKRPHHQHPQEEARTNSPTWSTKAAKQPRGMNVTAYRQACSP